MFEISFGEMVLVLVVALLVLGPERLPKAANAVGRYAGHARSYLRTMMSQLQTEAQAADLRKEVQSLRQGLRNVKAELSGQVSDTITPDPPKNG